MSVMPKRQSGFNLIENMVTLFIISVGMLGIAGMQLTALKVNQNSHFYSQALILGKDIADRMRANMIGVVNGNYDLGSETFDVAIGLNGNCQNENGCSARDMAGHDIQQWWDKLETTLPIGNGFVCIDSTPSFDPADYVGMAVDTVPATCDGIGDSYVIHVVWDMGNEKDGNIILTTDADTSDGHLVMAFYP